MPARSIMPAQFIRQHILNLTINEFAVALGVDQSRASRFDTSGVIPEQHHRAIKQLAGARGIKFNDSWFNSVPFARDVPR